MELKRVMFVVAQLKLSSMKYKNVIIFLFLVCFSNGYSQVPEVKNVPKLEYSFSPISTGKLDKETDEMVDSWETSNIAVYKVYSSRKVIEYTEYKENSEEVVKTWTYPIIRYSQDDLVHVFGVLGDKGEVTIVFWKDKSMVALQDVDWDYIITKK